MTPNRKKFEEVAEHLELAIFSGRLSVGDKVSSERDLMHQFGVGRSTVREALFTLQRKGLLTVNPGTAARVSRPDANTLVSDLTGVARHLLSQPGGVRQLQSVRALFEIGVARLAAKHATAADIEQLRLALEANGDAADQPTFTRTDLTFHYTIAMISHNPMFTSIHHALMAWLAEQRTVSARSGVAWPRVVEEHRAIFEAIAARDAEAAENAMERHLESVAQNYWQTMTAPR